MASLDNLASMQSCLDEYDSRMAVMMPEARTGVFLEQFPRPASRDDILGTMTAIATDGTERTLPNTGI